MLKVKACSKYLKMEIVLIIIIEALVSYNRFNPIDYINPETMLIGHLKFAQSLKNINIY